MFTAANKLSVIEYLIAAWNAHDVDGVLESFTDDAVITIVLTLPNTSDVYAGKPQICAFVQANILDFAAKARDYEVLGNTGNRQCPGEWCTRGGEPPAMRPPYHPRRESLPTDSWR